jgi:hypothetical protein
MDVTNVEPKFIVSLLEEVERLESELTKGIGDMEMIKHHKERIDEERATIVRRLAIDAGGWSQLHADQQKHLLDRLMAIRDELLARKGVGQARPLSYIPESEDEPKHLILWLTIFGFIFAATLLSLIR